MSSPLPLAPFPLTLLSDQLTLAEFFHFNRKTEQFQAEYKIIRRLDIQAYAVESPEVWNASLASPEQDRSLQVPERLLLFALTPPMRDLLFEAGMICGQRKGASRQAADVIDGVGILTELFAKLQHEGMPLATMPFRVHGYDASLAMAVVARTPPAIARLMKTLRISRWKVSMMAGWSCHNHGAPMAIARMPEDVTVRGFFEQAHRIAKALAGTLVILDVQLFSLLGAGEPLSRDRLPERLILATRDFTLRSSLQKVACGVGAPRRAEDLNGFMPPHNVGQPGIFAGMFRDMEAHGLTAITWLVKEPGNPADRPDNHETFILVRTQAAVAALLEKLGIGGMETFEAG